MNESQIENCERGAKSLGSTPGPPSLPISSSRKHARIPPLTRADRNHQLPLSFAQERIWFLEQLGLVGTAYNMPFALRLEGDLDLAALERSFVELLRRHESLRTHFITVDGVPLQVIDQPGEFSLVIDDLTKLSADEKARLWRKHSAQEARRPFDLRKGPLLRASILRLDPQVHVLLLTIHHIAADGWSLGILHRELGTLYRAFSQDLPSPLPNLAVQYADYAVWQRNWLTDEVLEGQLQYWRDRMSGAPAEISLPVDHSRPAIASFNGGIVSLDLPQILVRGLERLARSEHATLFMVVLAAFQILLSRFSGQPDVLVGSATAGRNHPLVEDLIGFFVNTVVLRTDLSDRPTFRSLLSRVRELTLDAYAHQDLPFEKVVRELRPDRNLAHQPVFQVALALQNVPYEEMQLPGLKWARVHVDQGTALFDLTLQLFEDQGGLRAEFEYATDLFERETIGRMAEQYRALLEAIVTDPDTTVVDYSLNVSARHADRQSWYSGLKRQIAPDDDIVRVLERRAAATPDLPSLCSGEQVLTYGQLNERANAIARSLMRRGIAPGDKIGVYLGRCIEGVVSFYAILKTGAVYVPLDRDLPAERLIWMCRDSAIRHVLTPAGELAPFELPETAFIEVSEEHPDPHAEGCSDIGRPMGELSPAYAIYTSGSTGKPKGVLLSRRGIANIASAQRRIFQLQSMDRILQLASLSFDASIFEFVLALGAGATLCLGAKEDTFPGPALLAFIHKHTVSALVITPSALAALSATHLPSLRTLIVAGEEFPPELARSWAKKCRVFNAYGPTETTIWATTHRCSADAPPGRVPIGGPIDNTEIYVLNAALGCAGIGEVAELCVGGVGVALEYINRPELTSERFIEDSRIGPGRIYRTGDLVRRLADGKLEFLGRVDLQTKIRGYRIEPGEVEACLQEHPAVRQAVVLSREDVPGERRLVGYVVGDRGSGRDLEQVGLTDGLREEVVADWEALYEDTYGDQRSSSAPGFTGWNSSYTGEPIPEPQMAEWLRNAVARIRALHPRRVLELGCGAGLVLQHVAPQCELYVGTDISAAAVAGLVNWAHGREGFEHVHLRRGSALDVDGFDSESFDTVILNSVIQYFPDINYLVEVLKQVSRLVRPGGHVFVGDVRHLGLLSTFHSAVQLCRASDETSVAQLRERIARAFAQEKELLISPEFFRELSRAIPRLGLDAVLLKRGRALNELTRYRYDVVMRAGGELRTPIVSEALSWPSDLVSETAAEIVLRSQRWEAIRIHSIPNARISYDVEAKRLIESSDGGTTVEQLRRQLEEAGGATVDPEDICEMAEMHDFDVAACWSQSDSPERFEVTLIHRSAAGRLPCHTTQVRGAAVSWSDFANDPLESLFRQRLVPNLRDFLRKRLPEFMVPSAWVLLNAMPLTSAGKVDRRALPAPQHRRGERSVYVAPTSTTERAVAEIWSSILRIDQVGVADNFFELGGHSLLIVQMLEQLRLVGLHGEVKDVYGSPTLADFAGTLRSDSAAKEPPGSLIPAECEEIKPEMVPLVNVRPGHLERIVRSVAGGAANIKDIYPLTALQEGILFHYLLSDHSCDVYVVPSIFSVSSRITIDRFIDALQAAVDRHDALRTAILWDGLPQPVQVVYRRAPIAVEWLVLGPNQAPLDRIREAASPRDRIDIRKAPLVRLKVACDALNDKHYLLLQVHHIACDNESEGVLLREIAALMKNSEATLGDSVPYRNYLELIHAYGNTGASGEYFLRKLGDLEEITAPYGLSDVRGDGTRIIEARRDLEFGFCVRLRNQAKQLAVTPAAIFHAAWALLVAMASGCDDVVFGTVLLGRMRASAARSAVGLYINTLPLRVNTAGVTVGALVKRVHDDLSELLNHECASLAEAQRCSSIPGSGALFSALINYRHSEESEERNLFHSAELEFVESRGRTNFPMMLSVDDRGEIFALEMETDREVDPERVIGCVVTALQSIVRALEIKPDSLASSLSVVSGFEIERVIREFNGAAFTRVNTEIHEVFEDQVGKSPDALALAHAGQRFTYGQLNRRANQLARYLVSEGVGPDRVVGICVERGVEMVVGLLAILKAGGAYLPLDPSYPSERLQQMLEDAAPQVVLTEGKLMSVLSAAVQTRLIALDQRRERIADFPQSDLTPAELGLSPQNLVYVIYTSGSTGKPKGTAMRHRSVVNLIEWHRRTFGDGGGQRVLQFAALSFDVAFQEIFSTLCTGGTLVLLDEWVRRDAKALTELLIEQGIERLFIPPLMLQSIAEHCRSAGEVPGSLKDVITAGEQLRISAEIRDLFGKVAGSRLHNHYGPTETHVVTALTLEGDPQGWPDLPSIGRPIANTQIYVLDAQIRPVPIGVAGEIYIGGANVAKGYLNRPELTAQRFVPDPYSTDPEARLYKTGDLGRWTAEGTLEYLGRNDDQVKVRGFRIELGEIEARLMQHEGVREAAVVAREDTPGEKRLVAYLTARGESTPGAEELRAHLKAVLPEHMVPSAFVPLQSLPLTPSGKLNRRALPAPTTTPATTRGQSRPKDGIESAIAGVWTDLLHVDEVGRDDNFFDLGGHSILATRMCTRLRELMGMDIPVAGILENPTVVELGKYLTDRIARTLKETS